MKIASRLDERLPMNNGIEIPQVGLGVWRASDGPETRNAGRWSWDIEALTLPRYTKTNRASGKGSETAVCPAKRFLSPPRSGIRIRAMKKRLPPLSAA